MRNASGHQCNLLPLKKRVGGLIRERVLNRGFKLCAGRDSILVITSVFAGHYWRFLVGEKTSCLFLYFF